MVILIVAIKIGNWFSTKLSKQKEIWEFFRAYSSIQEDIGRMSFNGILTIDFDLSFSILILS